MHEKHLTKFKTPSWKTNKNPCKLGIDKTLLDPIRRYVQ
jgi:hypothetical protein